MGGSGKLSDLLWITHLVSGRIGLASKALIQSTYFSVVCDTKCTFSLNPYHRHLLLLGFSEFVVTFCLENAMWNEFLWKMGLHFYLWKPKCQLSLSASCGSWDSGTSTKLSQLNTLLWREDTKEQKEGDSLEFMLLKLVQPWRLINQAGSSALTSCTSPSLILDHFLDLVLIPFVPVCEPSDFLSLNLSTDLAWVSFCCFLPGILTRRDPSYRWGDENWSYFGKRLDRICWGIGYGMWEQGNEDDFIISGLSNWRNQLAINSSFLLTINHP